MISFFVGENSFEIERELQKLISDFDGQAEKIDRTELNLSGLPDLLMGTSLFAEKRLVIIKNLSDNKEIWAEFPKWLERLSDDISLILVEEKPDKRTSTFKFLQKNTTQKNFPNWNERDVRKAEDWTMAEAETQGIKIDRAQAQKIVERVGVDQWGLFHALEKLAVVGEITIEEIEDVVELSPTENVFALFETALKGDSLGLREKISALESLEDPHMVLGLLAGQAFQLAALAADDNPSSQVAKDVGAHPFVMQKLSPFAKRFGRQGSKKVLFFVSDADADVKMSVAEPWILIERALQKIAAIKS